MDERLNYRYKKPANIRFALIFLVCIAFFVFLTIHLFRLQVMKHAYYSGIAQNNRTMMLKLPPARGLILDRNLKRLAMNVPRSSLYAAPRYIKNKDHAAAAIAELLNKDKQEILDRIYNDKMFVWIARKLSDEQAAKVKEMDITGIGLIVENERSYPNGSLAAHVLGFVDVDNNGLEGVEKYYDKELCGTYGYKATIVDAMRREVDSLNAPFLPPHNGFDLVLSIDETIQHITEKALYAAAEKYHPKSASIAVMAPASGDILALSNWPTYDLNNFKNSSAEERRNRAVTDILEPGSAFKIVTASGVLEEQIVGMDDEYDCESGKYFIEGRVLHDHRPHGILRFKNIMEVSSNIGVVKVAQKLGAERLCRYTKLFGFGQETGVDLPGEVEGIVRPLSKWSRGSIAAVPIGQEVASTTIQLAAAISCIANDGVLMRPRVLKRFIDDEGNLIKEFRPKPVRRVISKATCLKMKELLNLVVTSGTGTRASMRGYSAAGKTGTGQRLESDGSYSHSKFNAIFIGFAPVDNPKIAIAIVFVEPRPIYYGGMVAAPVFSQIADSILRYMGEPPDRETF